MKTGGPQYCPEDDALNRTLRIAWSCLFALILTTATGCRQHRTREFVAVQRPVKFENWRLYVNVFVDAANPSPTNQFYLISAVAWTAPRDYLRSDPSQFRPTTYEASLNSLRLFRIDDTNSVELPLPPLHHGSDDQPNRLVGLASGNRAGILIPASVNDLRAEVAMTFRHRETGRTEAKVFTMTMRKREGTKIEPLLE